MIMCPAFYLFFFYPCPSQSLWLYFSYLFFYRFLFLSFFPSAAGCDLSSGVFRCEQRLSSQEETRLGCRHNAFFLLFFVHIYV